MGVLRVSPPSAHAFADAGRHDLCPRAATFTTSLSAGRLADSAGHVAPANRGRAGNAVQREIAERAGLTKSTFFRHFRDKREVLCGDRVTGLVVKGITAAPAAASPLEAVAYALDIVGREAFTPDRREFSARRRAVIVANPELREREALKGLILTASMIDALKRAAFPT